MKHIVFVLIILGAICFSCQEKSEPLDALEVGKTDNWTTAALQQRALQQLDSTQRDTTLFKQDIDTYNTYQSVFQSFPLHKSPFPVAEYDYAVSYIPFSLKLEENIFTGVRIGECDGPDCEVVIDKMTLLVLTNDEEAEESTLVESRNYPYLTAEGFIKTSKMEYDWVFSATPDGFSSLLINMKFFDLRFGETIVIYPQTDNSFLYDQIEDSPNNYKNFDEFKSAILNLDRIKALTH